MISLLSKNDNERFRAIERGHVARIDDTEKRRCVAVFYPVPGRSNAALQLAKRAAQAFNDWHREVLEQQKAQQGKT